MGFKSLSLERVWNKISKLRKMGKLLTEDVRVSFANLAFEFCILLDGAKDSDGSQLPLLF